MNVAGKSDVGELVGRTQEFEQLLALLEEARSGRGRAALVLGEAGIGKTRLTEAFAAASCSSAFAPPVSAAFLRTPSGWRSSGSSRTCVSATATARWHKRRTTRSFHM